MNIIDLLKKEFYPGIKLRRPWLNKWYYICFTHSAPDLANFGVTDFVALAWKDSPHEVKGNEYAFCVRDLIAEDWEVFLG